MLLSCKGACSCRLRLRNCVISSNTGQNHAVKYCRLSCVAKSAASEAPSHHKSQLDAVSQTATRGQPPSSHSIFLPLLTALKKVNNDPKQLVGWEVRLLPKAAVSNRRSHGRCKSPFITKGSWNNSNPDGTLGCSLGQVVEVLTTAANPSADAEKTAASVNSQQSSDEEKPPPPPPPLPPPPLSGRRSTPGGTSGTGAACSPGTEPAARTARATSPTVTASPIPSAAPDADQLQPQTVMLRAVQHIVVQEYDFAGYEEYVIRLDPEVVPYVDISSRTLVVEPSEGLLQQGRKSLLLQLLHREITNLSSPVLGPLDRHLPTTPTATTEEEAPRNLPQQPRDGRGTAGSESSTSLSGASTVLSAAYLLPSRPAAEMVVFQAGQAVPARGQGHSLGRMPTRKELLDAGREDLVTLISEAGGFSEVARNLGLRCTRRRRGYWSGPGSWNRLREELAAFVACGWVELPHPDNPERTYFYNQISQRTTWRRPPPPQRLPAVPGSLGVDGASSRSGGGERWMVVEAAADRVMPSRSLVLQARRLDLHYAIEIHGGYLHVAARLGRRVTWAPSKHLYDSPAAVRRELSAVAKELQLPPGVLPTSRELRLSGYGTLLNAVRRHEGLRDLLGIRRRHGSRSRRPRDRWDDLGVLAKELARIAGENAEAGTTAKGTRFTDMDISGSRGCGTSSAPISSGHSGQVPGQQQRELRLSRLIGIKATTYPEDMSVGEVDVVASEVANSGIEPRSVRNDEGQERGVGSEPVDGGRTETGKDAVAGGALGTVVAAEPAVCIPAVDERLGGTALEDSTVPSRRGRGRPRRTEQQEAHCRHALVPGPDAGRAPVGADSATVAAMTTPPLLLPRLSQLRTAGRHDLIYALSIRHAGRQQELAELAGLQLARDGRGRNRNALSLEAVVEAIQAACQTPKQIREYLRKHRQTDISRQHLTSYLARMASEGRLVKMSYGRYGLRPAAA
ncbi:hypothetical protein Vretifemale_15838 [Volvox reticuliferus]|uniref:WW domain-containing protein n=1 Tax=Volvox reticuliferus TaxID=1737510 RepID=A0A8J4CSH0_9CHLO|nr:hypothetical protein Vretifemale_15838 [Volvox reticuliferus]